MSDNKQTHFYVLLLQRLSFLNLINEKSHTGIFDKILMLQQPFFV